MKDLWPILLLCVVLWGGCQGAPQAAMSRRTLFMEPTKDVPGPEKNYTGIRVKEDSLRMVYHSEQTVAVVEVGKSRELFNCELLEVKTKQDKQVALDALKKEIPHRMKISFPNMRNLMEQCQKLELPHALDMRYVRTNSERTENEEPRGLSSIFSGVFPGTKWCGTGDIAGSYHDLGEEKRLDKCCRTHDLCPVKVAGLKTQYNITNYAIYTRSHCECDENFYKCLKRVKSTLSDFLGNIYFNVAQVTCVEDFTPEGDKVQRRFKVSRKRY